MSRFCWTSCMRSWDVLCWCNMCWAYLLWSHPVSSHTLFLSLSLSLSLSFCVCVCVCVQRENPAFTSWHIWPQADRARASGESGFSPATWQDASLFFDLPSTLCTGDGTQLAVQTNAGRTGEGNCPGNKVRQTLPLKGFPVRDVQTSSN